MECFIGMIIPWTANYEPADWLYCRGQILNVRGNDALFAVIGARFGGDGVTTFRLPDLREKVILGSGRNYNMANTGGSKTTSLQPSQMPVHTHMLQGNISPTVAGSNAPDGAHVLGVATTVATRPVPIKVYNKVSDPQLIAMSYGSITSVGQGNAHSNMQPYIILDYIICINGVYPMRDN